MSCSRPHSWEVSETGLERRASLYTAQEPKPLFVPPHEFEKQQQIGEESSWILKNMAGFFMLVGRLENNLEKETLKQVELNQKYAKRREKN